MKHTIQKSLAVLLAMLMLLGTMATGVAATEEEPTLSVQDPVISSSEEEETEAAEYTEASGWGLDFESAEELLLGQPKTVSLSTQWVLHTLFKFTPTESGKYCFRSNGGQDSVEPYIDPWAVLCDKDGNGIVDSEYHWDDDECVLNFAIYRELEAGKTYYLKPSTYGVGEYTVRVDACSDFKKLVVSKKEITIEQGEYVSIADLLAGTTWNLRDLRIDASGDVEAQYEWDGEHGFIVGITGVKGGRAAWLSITAPDGENASILVKLKRTAWEWIKYYLLFGWLVENGEGIFAYLFFGLMPVWVILINVGYILFFPLITVVDFFKGIFR